ncbi:MAG: 4'-phosphopantetheinyl transferase family protein [Thermoplasmatota archaeon]
MHVPPLAEGELHVWTYRLGGMPADMDASLSAEERSRARSFRDDLDRGRYLLAHAGLRALLAGYSGHPPEALAFDRRCRHCGAGHGKPRLKGDGAPSSLSFNMSHSCGVVAYAVARGEEVGVDVEHDHGPMDASILDSLPPGVLAAVPAAAPATHDVLARWTEIEAYLKALGHGLVPPDDLQTGRPPGVWRIEAPAGYVGAVAAGTPDLRVRQFDLAPQDVKSMAKVGAPGSGTAGGPERRRTGDFKRAIP